MRNFERDAKIFGTERFTLKPEHIALLRHSYTSWWSAEYGAACIDPKRPYGNSGSYAIHADMAEILGIKPTLVKDGEKIFSDEQEELMDDLHRELEIALQIVLVTGSFETGKYEKVHYDDMSWRKIVGE